MEKNTYVVLFPFGTGDRSYALFDSREDAEKKLDNETNITGLILPLQKVTFGIIIGESAEEVEKKITDIYYDEDDERNSYERILTDMMDESQDMEQFQLEEVWAEINKNGKLIWLASGDDDKPEAENNGEVVRAWSDDDNMYKSEEDANNMCAPSQYLTI